MAGSGVIAAAVILPSQLVSGVRLALCGGAAQPVACLLFVLFDAFAFAVALGELVLRRGIARFGVLFQGFCFCGEVARLVFAAAAGRLPCLASMISSRLTAVLA